MSKTDKTKPTRVQIADATAAHGGKINWHKDVTFSRYQGDKMYRNEKMERKYKDWNDNYDY